MIYRNYLMILNVCFIFSNILSSEKTEPTSQQKAQWAADAEKWKRMTTAMQGKMSKPEEQEQAIMPSQLSVSQDLHNQKAKL